jgi:nitrate reductase (NAD(P)H)
MGEIVAMPAVDVTCTLTCAGNRRKEQNMVKKSIGFNWGPAGTGCSTWTGVRLADVLVACGVDLSGKAQHVCMRGPKGELPAGKDGSYGTSITIDRATNPAFDVILAYKQNGEMLTPDHGYPLRVIIPGYIGGRMIVSITCAFYKTVECHANQLEILNLYDLSPTQKTLCRNGLRRSQ